MIFKCYKHNKWYLNVIYTTKVRLFKFKKEVIQNETEKVREREQ